MEYKFIEKSFSFIYRIVFSLLGVMLYSIPWEGYRILRKFLKCGFCKRSIEFQEKNIILNPYCKNKRKISINNILYITYGIKKQYYYFIITTKGKIFSKKGIGFCKNCRERNICEEIVYIKESSRLNLLDEAIKHNILVLPSISQCEPHFSNECGTLYSYTLVNDKYILSVATHNKSMFWIFGGGRYKDENFSISNIFNNPKQFFISKEKNITNIPVSKFMIKILDKRLTLKRGYGIFPFINGKMIESKIFYSHDEDIIKRKISELLSL